MRRLARCIFPATAGSARPRVRSLSAIGLRFALVAVVVSSVACEQEIIHDYHGLEPHNVMYKLLKARYGRPPDLRADVLRRIRIGFRRFCLADPYKLDFIFTPECAVLATDWSCIGFLYEGAPERPPPHCIRSE
jgi:hypothetical protein